MAHCPDPTPLELIIAARRALVRLLDHGDLPELAAEERTQARRAVECLMAVEEHLTGGVSVGVGAEPPDALRAQRARVAADLRSNALAWDRDAVVATLAAVVAAWLPIDAPAVSTGMTHLPHPSVPDGRYGDSAVDRGANTRPVRRSSTAKGAESGRR
ncbi:MAG: hypothetical protein ACFCBW_19070 [Candidatus Competibacterales bacterium]